MAAFTIQKQCVNPVVSKDICYNDALTAEMQVVARAAVAVGLVAVAVVLMVVEAINVAIDGQHWLPSVGKCWSNNSNHRYLQPECPQASRSP
jgi:hypothetical protein